MLHFVSGFVKGTRDSYFLRISPEVRKFIALVGPFIVTVLLSLGWYSRSKTWQQSKKIPVREIMNSLTFESKASKFRKPTQIPRIIIVITRSLTRQKNNPKQQNQFHCQGKTGTNKLTS